MNHFKGIYQHLSVCSNYKLAVCYNTGEMVFLTDNCQISKSNSQKLECIHNTGILYSVKRVINQFHWPQKQQRLKM
jgi:hypothetical protein